MGMMHARRPGSLLEALEMVAYNERIIATSLSKQRRDRASAMLANLRPIVGQLEQQDQLAAQIALRGRRRPFRTVDLDTRSSPAVPNPGGDPRLGPRVERSLASSVRVIDGHEYEVVWDGSLDLTPSWPDRKA